MVQYLDGDSGLAVRAFSALADPARLAPDDLANWGNYFAALPQVMAGDVRYGHRVLTEGTDTTTVSWQSAS